MQEVYLALSRRLLEVGNHIRAVLGTLESREVHLLHTLQSIYHTENTPTAQIVQSSG